MPKNNYPIGINNEHCTSYNGYIYCAGTGLDNGCGHFVGYSNSNGGVWQSTTGYPQNNNDQACVTYDGYMYCLGGYLCNGEYTDTSYYASISLNGVGIWKSMSNSPYVSGENCYTYNGYAYCLAASSGPVAYYAPISESGIGTWKLIGDLHTGFAYNEGSCAVYNGDIYCVGGANPNGKGDEEYATLSSTGIGSFIQQNTWYPTASSGYSDITGLSCVAYNSHIYCVGGYIPKGSGGSVINLVYYAPISSSGIGTWTALPSYPTPIFMSSCFVE